MDQITSCPTCHQPVDPQDYFCRNCGANLKPKPLSMTFMQIVSLFIGSLVLPPMGIIWGYRYLKENDSKAKIFGLFLIVITIILIVVIVIYSINLINTVNNQIGKQMQNYGGF
jgi:hypothetical protein